MSSFYDFNGQFYGGTTPPAMGMAGMGMGMPNANNVDWYVKNGYLQPINGSTSTENNQNSSNAAMYQNPFSTAMSGTQSGTLQPYVNRMTQNASNALYGGLLGYKPQSLIAGDAGGTPQNSTVPQFNMPSSLGQGLNFTGFGNRSWMKGGQ